MRDIREFNGIERRIATVRKLGRLTRPSLAAKANGLFDNADVADWVRDLSR